MDFTDRIVHVFIGIVIAAPFTLWVRYKFVRVAEVSSRFDDLCDTIERAADVSTEYWCKDGADPASRVLEAQLRGHQTRIDLLIALLSEENWALKDLCENEQLEFYEAITGGNFEVLNRPAEHARAVDSQTAAAKFMVNLRHQRRALFRLLG